LRKTHSHHSHTHHSHHSHTHHSHTHTNTPLTPLPTVLTALRTLPPLRVVGTHTRGRARARTCTHTGTDCGRAGFHRA
jgi:hypothetical protein